MFIPYALISHSDSTFHQGDEIHETLIFERRRILECLADVTFFRDFNSRAVVDKCIEFEEDIV
jgi:hypothetical protein